MTNELKINLKKYIQPFEKILAFRELSALSGVLLNESDALEVGVNYRTLNTLVSSKTLVDRLTYWESVESNEVETITKQSLRESTINLVRNGIAIDVLKSKLPFDGNVPLPNRRCLRYGSHGIHEYRGKFFPQLVRSLINISGTHSGGTVADPMSGSGTTVTEAVLAGCKGQGLDMNPLSVKLGNVKVSLLSANPKNLELSYEQLRTELMASEPHNISNRDYFKSLPNEDQDYLNTWFSEDVLDAMDDICSSISRLTDLHSKDLARIALSNIIRSVSWQKVADLRIRKEVRFDVEIDPKKEFLEEIGRSVRAVLAFLYQNGTLENNEYKIIEGDARNCGEIWGDSSVDVIITSPPYATALPYLDTDRLSLCYLGLLPRPEHRHRDKFMIGNREVSEKIRKDYWERYVVDKASLPISVSMLIDKVHDLNAGTSVGFRRRNLPALLSKYFFDMKEVIEGMMTALKPGHFAYVVVGNNHTIAGGQRVNIQTAMLLQDIAASIGFEISKSLNMEMLVSRDIFKENAMASEEILVFKKPVI